MPRKLHPPKIRNPTKNPTKCVVCFKEFPSSPGAALHKARVHDGKGPQKGKPYFEGRHPRSYSPPEIPAEPFVVDPLSAPSIKSKVVPHESGEGVNVDIAYTPRGAQRVVHSDPAQFKVIVAHRRFGKTTLAINELIKAALLKPGRYWYVAPTYRQAKTIAYDLLQRYLPIEFVTKRNETELVFRLLNGSEIALKGAENEDTLRGVGLSGLVLDEYGEMARDVWEKVLEPTLYDNPAEPGWAIFIGTPKGRNHFYELYTKADGKKWKAFRFSAFDTNILTREFLAEKKLQLPEDTYREEYLAEFIEGEGMVFRGLKNVTKPKSLCYQNPDWDKRYQMGVDIARVQDWTVLTVVDTHTMTVVYWERFQRLDWEYQKVKIQAVAERYMHARVILDSTGVGDPIAQDLFQLGLMIEPYRISGSKAKKELIENLKLRIEQQQITIPDERELIEELEAYHFVMSNTGTIRYEAPHGKHDDAVMSLALALWDIKPVYQQTPVVENYGQLDDSY